MKIEYPAKITKDGDRYLVTFPDFAEAATEGVTFEEALFNAAEVLTLTLEGRVEEGMEICQPSRPKGKSVYMITPAARVQSAILLRSVRGDRSVADFARALGTSWPAAAKLEDPRHSPSLRQLEKAAAAHGKRLVVLFEDDDKAA
jgi:antitoxin HicB